MAKRTWGAIGTEFVTTLIHTILNLPVLVTYQIRTLRVGVYIELNLTVTDRENQ